jgi:hypothetical protein
MESGCRQEAGPGHHPLEALREGIRVDRHPDGLADEVIGGPVVSEEQSQLGLRFPVGAEAFEGEPGDCDQPSGPVCLGRRPAESAIDPLEAPRDPPTAGLEVGSLGGEYLTPPGPGSDGEKDGDLPAGVLSGRDEGEQSRRVGDGQVRSVRF